MADEAFSDVRNDLDSLCDEAREDYLGLWQIVMRTNRLASSDERAREDTLADIRVLLARGVRAGNLTGEGGFAAWPDQFPDSVIERVRREWVALGRAPTVNEIAWFDLPSDEQAALA